MPSTTIIIFIVLFNVSTNIMADVTPSSADLNSTPEGDWNVDGSLIRYIWIVSKYLSLDLGHPTCLLSSAKSLIQ